MTLNLGQTIEKVFKDSLGINKKEKILLIGDNYIDDRNTLEDRRYIADSFKKVADELGYILEIFFYSSVKNHGEEPPIELWVKCFGIDFCEKLFKNIPYELIKSKNVSLEEILKYEDNVDRENLPAVIIAISYYSTSHTLFRKFSNYLGCRYASMPMVEKEMFAGALNIDYNDLELKTLKLAEKVRLYKAVDIKNCLGTDLIVNFENSVIHCDTGNLKSKGSFGNLPAGEVYLPPQLKGTRGKVCLEHFKGKKLYNPVFIFFEDGVVVDLFGDKEIVDELNGIFSDTRNRVIAELGFGTNWMAKNPVNVLEAEKIDGTCHVAIGDNITFGGNNRASVHIDFVISNPDFRWIK